MIAEDGEHGDRVAASVHGEQQVVRPVIGQGALRSGVVDDGAFELAAVAAGVVDAQLGELCLRLSACTR